ncbi:hypothetical protein [Streptomyces sp. SPB162]|uniref:SecDF P1 head subdomain-containing protein n=1 Tax=Streptomyces sp. SPB162 TaxID=2940560 RepID=UPI0024059E36|nr:hypothetical protein [Streptomyces sp. SPB162]MDF9816452.1 preprotein translocase subunit SecD [Streptomyces sp. SPB162]
MRTLRTISPAPAVTAVAAVLVMSAALTGCSGSSGTTDGKATSPLSGSSRTADASAASSTPASGRTTVTYTPRSAPGDETLRHTADLLRARVAAAGLKDTKIEVHGGTITATAPGDTGDRLRQLAVRAELGFRPVLGSDTAVPPPALRQQFAAYDCKAPATTPTAPPADPTVACDTAGPVKYALGAAALTGRDVTSAKASLDAQTGAWIVNLEFTSAGGAKFAQLTGTLSQQLPPANLLGILLDRKVLSAPSVSSSITGGKVQISGNFTRTSAEDLAAQISSGALPVDLNVSDVTRIPS